MENFLEKFADAFEIEDPAEISIETEFRDLSQWDSLGLLSLIAMIDEEYDVIIEADELGDLKTIGDLIDEVKKRKQE